MENLPAIIEALILASEAPLALEKICSVLEGVDKNEIRDAIEKLISDYDGRESGICIQEVAGGYQFRTRPALALWVKKLKGVKPTSLSPAALETLAIVAYRQPIVKAEIESIRGVDVSAPLKGLMEKKLIRIVGRKDVPGKPIIYGTTKKFLEVFNLKELTDLPTMRELKEITEHQEVYEQETIDFDELTGDIQTLETIEETVETTETVESPEMPDQTETPDVQSQDLEQHKPEIFETQGEISEEADSTSPAVTEEETPGNRPADLPEPAEAEAVVSEHADKESFS